MRLSEEKIREGILHSDKDVREAAVNYFSDSFTEDATITALAIEAIERYGWDDVDFPRVISGLPLDGSTLLWVLEQIQREDTERPGRDDWSERWQVLHELLRKADAHLLASHRQEIDAVRILESGTQLFVARRIKMLSEDTDSCWRALNALSIRLTDAKDYSEVDSDIANALIEAIARDKDGYADKALKALGEKVEYLESTPQAWMQEFAAQLAGKMRLKAAIPLLVGNLVELGQDAEFLKEICTDSLAHIGGDEVVSAVAAVYREGDDRLRMVTCVVLDHIHTELSVSSMLEFLRGEEDRTVRAFLGSSLASQFAYESIEPLRQLVIEESYDKTFADLKHQLVTMAILMDVDFPEREQWKADVEESRREREEWHRGEDAPPAFEDMLTDAELGDDFDEPEPMRAAPRVGRNDPCPCGSGKKYKKCCIRKEQSTDFFP